jgi:heptosyltransferase-2
MPNGLTHVIIQTGFIGDIALTMFLLEEIKIMCPTCRLVFVTTPAGAELAKAFPNIIDEVIAYDKRGVDVSWKGIKRIISMIRQQSAASLISLHQSFRTSIIVACSGVSLRAGYTTSSLSSVYNHRVPYHKHVHEIERQRAFLTLHIFPNVTKEINLYKRQLLNPAISLTGNKKQWILIAPGSVWNTKKWPAHHFRTLIELLLQQQPHPICLIGSETDRELCESIIPAQHHERVQNVAGTMSLNETIQHIRSARLLIANDSAPIHMASLVNCPTIALFGPTHPGFGFAPISDNALVLQRDLSCRPCSIHGQHECPIGTHACMEQLLPIEVLKSALDFLN